MPCAYREEHCRTAQRRSTQHGRVSPGQVIKWTRTVTQEDTAAATVKLRFSQTFWDILQIFCSLVCAQVHQV